MSENSHDDPEDRIRELERPLADAARSSELGSSQPAGQAYPPGPTGPPPPGPWTYGGPYGGPFGPPPKPPSSNRMWWILGTVIVIGVVALAGGIAAFASHQLSGVRSIINSPPTISGTFSPQPTTPRSPTPSTSGALAPTSPAPPPGGELSISGINVNRTIACNDSIVSISGVSNTVVITGHCTSLTVSGVQNSITVDAVDTIDASGFNNKVTYHSGTPKITNVGDSNVVQQG
jgi:hypothetical protein